MPFLDVQSGPSTGFARGSNDRGTISRCVVLHILLYANDGAWVAHSAEGLQAMLRSYCAKWRLIVNVSTMKCIVWSTAQVNAEVFTYGGEIIKIVKDFCFNLSKISGNH